MLEEHSIRLFHSLENYDVTLVPRVSVVALAKLLLKVTGIKFLMVSDETSCNPLWFKDLPYNSSIYDSRKPKMGRESAWVTYDVVLHLLSSRAEVLTQYDVILLDSVDDRTLNSDIFLAMLGMLKVRSKFLIPTKSDYQVHIYKEYLQSFDYRVNVLDLVPSPPVSLYHSESTPTRSKLHKEMLNVIDRILSTESATTVYDILVILPIKSEVLQFRQLLIDHSPQRTFSILTDIKEYTPRGSNRKVLICTRSTDILNASHKVKYIVDCGLLQVEQTDPNGLHYLETQITNKNKIQQHMATLHMDGSKYFVMQKEEDIVSEFHIEILNKSLICHILLSMKFPFKFTDLLFLTSPNVDQVTNAMSQLCYLGLMTISGDEYFFTDVADDLVRFQFSSKLSTLSLFLSLVHSKAFNCSDELLKITSMIIAIKPNTLSSHINNQEFDKSIVSDTSDFFTALNAYNLLIKTEKRRTQMRDIFSKEVKKEVKYQFNMLQECLGTDMHSSHGTEDDIQRCLIKGFQLHATTLKKSFDAGDNPRMLLTPIFTFQDTSMEIIMKKPLSHLENFSDGDVFIFAELSLDGSQGMLQKGYANVCGRIDKEAVMATTSCFRKIAL